VSTLSQRILGARAAVVARALPADSVGSPAAGAFDAPEGARPGAADGEDEGGVPRSQRRSAIACLLAALVLVVLDAAIANVALPAIARSLVVSPAEAVRVVTAYQMALVMALLPCAALGESLGYRRVYTAGVALFVGASVLCALAPSLSFLVAARFLQGLGGAAILSLGVALLRLVVPRQQLGTAIGWNALVVALSSAAGPTLGSLVVAAASWPCSSPSISPSAPSCCSGRARSPGSRAPGARWISSEPG
jgi:MFS family permease